MSTFDNFIAISTAKMPIKIIRVVVTLESSRFSKAALLDPQCCSRTLKHVLSEGSDCVADLIRQEKLFLKETTEEILRRTRSAVRFYYKHVDKMDDAVSVAFEAEDAFFNVLKCAIQSNNIVRHIESADYKIEV